jgi:hypothetical protein
MVDLVSSMALKLQYAFLILGIFLMLVTGAQFLEGCIEQKPDLMLSERPTRGVCIVGCASWLRSMLPGATRRGGRVKEGKRLKNRRKMYCFRDKNNIQSPVNGGGMKENRRKCYD